MSNTIKIIYVLTHWNLSESKNIKTIGIFSSFEKAKKAAEDDLIEKLNQYIDKQHFPEHQGFNKITLRDAFISDIGRNTGCPIIYLCKLQYHIQETKFDSILNVPTNECRVKTIKYDPEFHVDIDFTSSIYIDLCPDRINSSPEFKNYHNLIRENIKKTIYGQKNEKNDTLISDMDKKLNKKLDTLRSEMNKKINYLESEIDDLRAEMDDMRT